jgi:hypothetical protein
MPRLTDTEYLIRHDMIARVWRGEHSRLSYLTARQQRDLHDYFQTTSTATDEELVIERRRLTEAHPSLPHRASRAFLALLRPSESTLPGATRSSKNITVRPVIRPDIDVDHLARALMDLVASLPQEERDRLAEEGRTMRERRERGAA